MWNTVLTMESIIFSNDWGVRISLSTLKEFQKYLQKFVHNKREIFKNDSKDIKFGFDGNEIFVGHGFSTKIVFDHVLPEMMIRKYAGTISEIFNKNK